MDHLRPVEPPKTPWLATWTLPPVVPTHWLTPRAPSTAPRGPGRGACAHSQESATHGIYSQIPLNE